MNQKQQTHQRKNKRNKHNTMIYKTNEQDKKTQNVAKWHPSRTEDKSEKTAKEQLRAQKAYKERKSDRPVNRGSNIIADGRVDERGGKATRLLRINQRRNAPTERLIEGRKAKD